jgi:regulator of RNase E activity RraA
VEVGGIVVHPGDVIHADAEGVIKIPHSCIAELAARAVQMRAFEHEAHLALRRADLSLAERRRRLADALAKYGFTAPH